MVSLFLCLFIGVNAEDSHSLLQARSAIQMQGVSLVAQFSGKVQSASGVVSMFKEESMMCAMVIKGAQAPVVGFFTQDNGMPRAVHAHFIAPTNGKYCVEDRVFSMLQRSYGIHSAQDAEDAIGQKDEDNGNHTTQENQETEQTTGGKNGGENTDRSTNSKSGTDGTTETTTETTTTDGPGAHCSDDGRRCCADNKTCDVGYEPVWDPNCEYGRYSEENDFCFHSECYQCFPTGDSMLETPICGRQIVQSCRPGAIVRWSRGVDYEGNPYRESDEYFWAACVNETHSKWDGQLKWDAQNIDEEVVCIGSNYRERGCNYNHYVSMHNTTDMLPTNLTIADYEWTGTLCRFLDVKLW